MRHLRARTNPGLVNIAALLRLTPHVKRNARRAGQTERGHSTPTSKRSPNRDDGPMAEQKSARGSYAAALRSDLA